MNNQVQHIVAFEAVQSTVTKSEIIALLDSDAPLLGWQRLYLKSAANCTQISETQTRVIREIVGAKT